MKKILFSLGLFAFMLGLAGVAGATSHTFTDTYIPRDSNGDPMAITLSGLGGGNGVPSHGWTFDIKKDRYDPTTQQIVSASIFLDVKDDGRDPGPIKFEIAGLTIGQNQFTAFLVINGKTIEVSGLASLNRDGTLYVRIYALVGDFIFYGATLTAEGQDKSAPVPEPSTVMLLGSGLLGLGIWHKRRMKKPPMSC